MRKLILAVALVTATSPALARETGDLKKVKDPNRIVCKTGEVIGSRLGTKKTCMTAMQWEQLEREQRTTVERIQTYKPTNGY